VKAEDLMILGAAALVAVGLVWYVKKGGSTSAQAVGAGIGGTKLADYMDPGLWNPLTGQYESYPSNWAWGDK
jgi:hypothetical protein